MAVGLQDAVILKDLEVWEKVAEEQSKKQDHVGW